jgi:hypothetical protein
MTDMYDEKVKVFQGGSMKPYPAEAFGVEVSSSSFCFHFLLGAVAAAATKPSPGCRLLLLLLLSFLSLPYFFSWPLSHTTLYTIYIFTYSTVEHVIRWGICVMWNNEVGNVKSRTKPSNCYDKKSLNVIGNRV